MPILKLMSEIDTIKLVIKSLNLQLFYSVLPLHTRFNERELSDRLGTALAKLSTFKCCPSSQTLRHRILRNNYFFRQL